MVIHGTHAVPVCAVPACGASLKGAMRMATTCVLRLSQGPGLNLRLFERPTSAPGTWCTIETHRTQHGPQGHW